MFQEQPKGLYQELVKRHYIRGSWRYSLAYRLATSMKLSLIQLWLAITEFTGFTQVTTNQDGRVPFTLKDLYDITLSEL